MQDQLLRPTGETKDGTGYPELDDVGEPFTWDDIPDFDLEIQQLETSLELAGDESTRSVQFRNLGRVYANKHTVTDEILDLNKAIENYQEARNLALINNRPQTGDFVSLAIATYHRFLQNGERCDIGSCIQLLEDSLKSPGAQYLPSLHRQKLLAQAYHSRWNISREDGQDLDRSTVLFEQIMDLTSADDDSHTDSLMRLGVLYENKFDRTGNLEDLEYSLKRSQDALTVLSRGSDKSQKRAEVLLNLGTAFGKRFDRLGDSGDLDCSITYYADAVEASPDSTSPLERYGLLLHLGLGHTKRYQNLDSREDLDISIRVLKSAVDLVTGHSGFQTSANETLGTLCQEKFNRTQDLADLDEAIAWLHKAEDPVPHDKNVRIRVSSGLILAFSTRYEILGYTKDVEESIRRIPEALLLVEDQSRDSKSDLLGTIVDFYLSKYARSKIQEYVEAAIEYGLQAVDLFSKDDPQLARNLESLSHTFQIKYRETGSEEDFEMQLKILQHALDLTPDDHPMRGSRLFFLAESYQQRFQREDTKPDLDMALRMLPGAFENQHTTLWIRISAGISLACLLMETGDIPTAYRVSIETLDLVSQLTPRSLEVSDMQILLRRVSGLPCIAGALALMAGREPDQVIQHLELGRGIILSSLSDMRIEMHDLQVNYPELAQEFIQLSDQLDTKPGLLTGFSNPRHDIGRKLNSVINEIRKLPGCDRFLLPPSEDQLKSAAINGPVVIINAMYLRTDALIIQRDEFISLELPVLYSDIKKFATNPEIDRQTLEWLWDGIASPILESLGYSDIPTGSTWPRICWILTGPLSTLPMHAAGHHYPGSTNTVIDRVISSYSSSVRALIQSRQNTARLLASRKLGKAVLVEVKELYHAPEEINELEKLCARMGLEIERLKPYREEVLLALPECEIFHFAGHGASHQLDPSQSSLKMQDGPVTVQDLFNMKLYQRAPFLAYLSACSTGYTEDERLVDEGLHLISACHLAGFRHIIGTLRRVNDQFCVEVAKMTYKWIEEHNLRDESVGEGLHHAIRKLRDQWMIDGSDSERAQRDLGGGESHDGQANREMNCASREGRDIVGCEEGPIHWAPFVYFGV
ncbi:unnamed protein product [Clonostachys solani]|uniref:CHAT domain-containing protein n=1 Tax=Clonostachys solani TaxID=160281 RepID=A0A9N9ZFB4_9HYPO|nr:unnamed protein product [Clonostachys solani]